jgi:hypothetical protein
MNRVAWTAAVFLLGGIASAGAVGEAGTIEACRKPGIATITDGKPIELPAGSIFADMADAGDRNPSGDSYRPVRLRLLQALEIDASARCGLARAEVYSNPRAFNVGPGEHRAYEISGRFAGQMPEVVVHVIGNFR